MVKRAIHYDKCSDAGRLASEYTVQGGDTPTVGYDASIGKFYYSWVRVIGALSRLVLDSMTPPGAFELTHLCWKNQSTFPARLGNGLYFSWRGATNHYLINFTDFLYFWRALYGNWYTFLGYAGMPNQTWYHVKYRVTPTTIYVKYWLYGTTEPDWMYISDTVGAGGTERPMRIKRSPGSAKIVFSSYIFVAGDEIRVSDIRITPIPRVSGGMAP